MNDPKIEVLEARIARQEATVQVLQTRVAALERDHRPATPAGAATATDTELDGQYGNPKVFRDPPRWAGPSRIGSLFSTCPPDYLEELAGFLEWRAEKEEAEGRLTKKGKAQAPYTRKDAALARGWAARQREPQAPEGSLSFGRLGADAEDAPEADIPF